MTMHLNILNLYLLMYVVLALDKKQITSITFADISKAFDTVWIKALILKVANILCFILIKCSEQKARFKKSVIML
jgi:hypothetical protein